MINRMESIKPVVKEISSRRSAMAFKSDRIGDGIISSLFDAASFAPSAYNEQPWRFYYAQHHKPEPFSRILSALAPGNQEWARNASMLVLTVAKTDLSLNGDPNYHAMHDLGLATAFLILQAESMGLVTHIMGGFDHERIREDLRIPAGYALGSVIAVGYPGDLSSLSEVNRRRATSPRSRKAIEEVAFEV